MEPEQRQHQQAKQCKSKENKMVGGRWVIQESLAATVAEQLQWQQKCTEMDRQNAHITRKHIHAVLCWLHTNLHVNMYVKHTDTHIQASIYTHVRLYSCACWK